MDYEKFYRYLDSRPSAEIKDCVYRVLELARKHSISVEDAGSEKVNEVTSSELSKQHRLQVSQQVWCQHAIWNKFGSRSAEHATLKDLKLATCDLLPEEKVADFIIKVNKMIKEEVGPAACFTAKEKQCGLEKWSKLSSLQHTKEDAADQASPPLSPPPRRAAAPASEHHHATSSDSEWKLSTDSGMESASDRSTTAVQKRRRTRSNTKMVWTPEKVRSWLTLTAKVVASNFNCKNYTGCCAEDGSGRAQKRRLGSCSAPCWFRSDERTVLQALERSIKTVAEKSQERQ